MRRWRLGEVDAPDPRAAGLPLGTAAALHDVRQAHARRLRRERILWLCTSASCFLAGLAAGLLWSV